MARPRSTSVGHDPIDRIDRADRHVAARVRERRVALGLSLQQLAAALGITYQQTFKYEVGKNRLVDIADALATPPGWFFDGLAEHPPPLDMPPFPRRLLDLVRMFDAMADPQRELLLQFSRDLAAQGAISPARPP